MRPDPPTAPEELVDAEARRRIVEDLDATLFVEAAAGTGKTTALVRRIVAVLRAGRGTLEEIVAVTFTEKAAGEMKLRLRGEIERARAGDADPADGGRAPEDPAPRERAHLERALEQLELAHIGTIHGFCTDLLKERPIEAGVDPRFEVAPDDERDRLLDRAFEGWFERVLSEPPPGVRRALRRHYARNSGGPRAALRDAAWHLVEHRDFDAAWSRPEWDREGALDRAVETLRELAGLAGRARKPDDYLARNLRNVRRFVEELDLREEVHGRDYDRLEAELRSLLRGPPWRRRQWSWRGYGSEYGDGLARDDVIGRRDAAKAAIEAILDAADAELAALLREELRPVVERYEELKRREGKLDFLDLLIRARDLLRDDDEIRAHYQRRFTHFFVDEFQDTDPLQAEILLLLCADDPAEAAAPNVRPVPGKLFLVGDPKQSIYRFRRADVMLYEETKRRLAAAGAEVLHLTTSFRSQPRLQAAVNGAFERRMTGSADGSQADYVPLARYRPDVADQPAAIALPVPEPYGQYGVWKTAIRESLPDAVGAFVDWLTSDACRWKVTERPESDAPPRLVDVAPRHVCLLFRRFQSWGNDVTRPYVRALEARGIPHVLVGGRSLYDREEVLAVRNALTAIEWPDDTLAVYAALKGPLFSLGDDALLAFTDLVGPLHPLRPHGGHESPAALETALRGELAGGRRDPGTEREAPRGGGGPAESPGASAARLREVAEALEILGRLHVRRNRRPIPETIAELFAAVRAHASIAIWPTGEQALANALRIGDRAREFERGGAPSFRAFLDRLEEEAERGQAEEAPIVEEGTEGVRIMTVHKAKGLEFPVVVLADMTCNATFETPSRHVDPARRLWAEPLCGSAPLELLENLELERRRERAEADRLAYVASTRARDLLVVPALADGRDADDGDAAEWWLDGLNPALYPPRGKRRAPDDAGRLGAPPFGPDGVLARERPDAPIPDGSVAPGLHEAEGGSEVVWWDPAALELGVEAPTAERQQRLLEVDETEQPTLSVEEGIRAHEAWRAQHDLTVAAGTKPEVRVVTVKERARAEVEAAGQAAAARGHDERPLPGVEWIEVPRPDDETRPGGERFGQLVHDALADVPLDGDEAAAPRAVRAHARALGAPEEEVDVAIAIVRRALAHPVLGRAAGLGGSDVRREVPLLVSEEGGERMLEGVADLAFRETGPGGEGRWTVVDYKTDRRISDARDLYERQVALYAAAISRITGEPATGIVLAL